MTDLVNRLLTEADERSRQIDDVKYQIDMKDKLIKEQTKQERDELRDRYQ